ncbi:MAG: magnesium transporter [Bacillota bacterium]|nr:magnesium transporter [Bacillota bacterium]
MREVTVELQIEELKEWIADKEFRKVKEALAEYLPVEIAELLNELNSTELVVVYRLLGKDLSADTFAYLDPDQQEHIINALKDKEVVALIEDLYFDDMIDLIEELPSNLVKKILKNTDPAERRLINQFLNYPEDTAGSIMTIEYVDLKKHMTVTEALARIKRIGIDSETVYTCYVTRADRVLEGLVSLRKLVTSEPEAIIGDLMKTDIISVKVGEDQESVASLFKKYDLGTMPVVDRENRLVGIITVDDIIDVIEKENTEDFQKMAGIQPTEESYLDGSILGMAKQRILWLLVLMLSATFTGRIIQGFEETLATVVILAAFIPMLMDTGGNAGSQSSTMVIRGIALGEISPRDTVRVIFKEIAIGAIVGAALSGINYLRIVYIEKVDPRVALVVTLTLFVTVVLAKTVGSVLPIVAKLCKADPAVMASPLITTIVDAVALVVYFQLAHVFLGIA